MDWKGWNTDINAIFKKRRLQEELSRGLGGPKRVAIYWCPYTLEVFGEATDPMAVEQIFLNE
jgi:hypothetical protein